MPGPLPAAERTRLTQFFLLSMAVSWACVFMGMEFRRMPSRSMLAAVYATGLFFVAGWIPTILAFAGNARAEGQKGTGGLLSGLKKWRVDAPWYVIAVTLLPLTWAGAMIAYAGIERRTGGSLDAPTGRVAWSLVAVINFLIVAPLTQEIPWRGYVLPMFLRSYDVRKAGALTGLLIGIWELGWMIPATFPQSDFLAAHSVEAAQRVAGAVALSMILSWIYANTGGSLLLAVIAAASYNAGELARFTYMALPQSEAFEWVRIGMLSSLALLLPLLMPERPAKAQPR